MTEKIETHENISFSYMIHLPHHLGLCAECRL